MKNRKRWYLGVFFAAFLAMSAFTAKGDVGAAAIEEEAVEGTLGQIPEGYTLQREVWSENPLYSGKAAGEYTLGEPVLVRAGEEKLAGASEKVCRTYKECTAAIREALKMRKTSFSITYATPNDPFDILQADDEVYRNLNLAFDEAFAHTGSPTEGDYLRKHYSSMHGSYQYSYDEATGEHLIINNYEVVYHDTAKQEAAADKAVAEFLQKYIKQGMSDYEKVSAIYTYLAKNVDYDFEHLRDESYTLKYTAYGALVSHKAVCQGFACTFYRLCLEVGVDARCIDGFGNGGLHDWNIVKLGGRYYNADATWDINYKEDEDWHWFLRCDKNFPDHIRNELFEAEEFRKAYPISTADYAPGVTAKSVRLNKTSVSTNVGLTVQLKATVSPANASNAEVTWKSSNTNVAKVGKNGLVTAVRAGTCKITAQVSSKVKAVCTVTVKEKYAYRLVKSGVYRLLTDGSAVLELGEKGWKYSKAFRVPGKSSKKVWQIYYKKTKSYRYTAVKSVASAAKKAGNTVTAAFYASEKTSVPVYEVYKSGTKPAYYYTTSKTTVKSKKKEGWTYKGIAWYAELSAVK